METTIEKLQSIVTQTSETFVRHYESDLKYIQEKSKLTIWIIGLSIGLEVFLLSKIESTDLESKYNLILLILSSLIFLFNSILGLIVRIKQTRVYGHFLKVILLYDYQKTQILLNLDPSTELGLEVIEDFSQALALEKLKELEYLKEKKTKNDPICEADFKYLHKSENWPSTLLIIQGILAVLLLISTI